MATPEGRIKAKLDRKLKARQVFYFNPQGTAFGKAGIPDKILCVHGFFIGIECKADATKKPTERQKIMMQKIEDAGGKCFVVCDDETMQVALDFIDRVPLTLRKLGIDLHAGS